MGCKSSWEYPKENARMMPTKYFLQLFQEGDGRYDVIFQETFRGTEDFTWTESSGDLAKFKKSYDKIRTKHIAAGDTCLYFTRKNISQLQKDTARYVVVDVNTLYNADGTIKAVGEDGTTSQTTYSFPRFQKYRIYAPDNDTKLLAAANGTVGFGLLHNLDFSLVQIEESFKMRGGEGSLRCTHYAVSAQSSVCYQMKAQGEQELLVIPEDKGLINLYVKDTANDILLEDVAAEGKQVCKLKWNIDKVSSLEIRIENKSDIPVSFIVVSN